MNRSTVREFLAPDVSVAPGGAGPDRGRRRGARPAAEPGRPAGGRDAAAQGQARQARAGRALRRSGRRRRRRRALRRDLPAAGRLDGRRGRRGQPGRPARGGGGPVRRGRVVGRVRHPQAAGRAEPVVRRRGAGARRRRGAPWTAAAPCTSTASWPADPDALAELAGQGALFVTSLDEVPDGATVVFPAHGVPAGVRAAAAARGLEIIDATCPLVPAAHAEARKFAERGDDVWLIGQPGHAAVAGIIGQAPAGPRWSPAREAPRRCG